MADTRILTFTDKKKLEEQSQQITEKDQQLSEKDQLIKQQALEKQLYAKLNAEGRNAELGRAFSDVDFRNQLLKEYNLQGENK